ncbi:MAG: hypothetical protein IKE22_14260 [Atopobiaceae bacterium]|nr:hypothetical protein [Atopobiaceae bacterium]
MIAIGELCRLLDERGEPYIRHGDDMVTWRYYTDPHSAIETLDGTLQVTGLTPEQAIAVTLGAGTCHEVEDEDTGFIVCSECGAVHDENYTSYYCWCCGKKVVGE